MLCASYSCSCITYIRQATPAAFTIQLVLWPSPTGTTSGYICSAFAMTLSMHVRFLNIMRKTHSIVTHTVTLLLALEKDSHPIVVEVPIREDIYSTYVSFERG